MRTGSRNDSGLVLSVRSTALGKNPPLESKPPPYFTRPAWEGGLKDCKGLHGLFASEMEQLRRVEEVWKIMKMGIKWCKYVFLVDHNT